MQKLGTVN